MTLKLDLDPEVKNFFIQLEKNELSLTLVGGAVRDLIKLDILSKDLDFEIRSKENLNQLDWEQKLQVIVALAKKNNYKIDKLPYLIFRIQIKEYSIEFSSPRIEVFNLSDHSHHNFTAQLFSQLDYKKAFKRRDFTINAIGLECNFTDSKFDLIDPFKGCEDLKLNLLKAIDLDFYHDNVRLLRTIRFSSWGYRVDESIDFKKFNLSQMSDFHFKNELLKSKPHFFLNQFIKVVKTIELDDKYKFFQKINFSFEEQIQTIEDIILFSLIHDELIAQTFEKLLSASKNLVSDLKNTMSHLQKLNQLNPDSLKSLVALDLEQLAKNEFFYSLKFIIEKKSYLNLLTKFGYKLKFNLEKLDSVKIDNEVLMQTEARLRTAYKLQQYFKFWIFNE